MVTGMVHPPATVVLLRRTWGRRALPVMLALLMAAGCVADGPPTVAVRYFCEVDRSCGGRPSGLDQGYLLWDGAVPGLVTEAEVPCRDSACPDGSEPTCVTTCSDPHRQVFP